MAPTRVVIDTDPGIDDAIAILLALASPEIEVVAITTVAGNVGLEATTLNARRLVELAHREVAIAAGCAEALAGPSGEAREVHGEDGLGNLAWPEPRVGLSPEHAVEVMARLVDEAPTTIVAIGPLTNLATLLDRHPRIDERVTRIVLMGGASFHGNVTPAAEFNVWADPEAAERVFAASWPITVVPLDLTHQVVLRDEDLAHLADLGTEVGRRAAAMLETLASFHERRHGSRDVIIHDPVAVYEVLAPGAISTQGVRVEIETGGAHSRGATWIDRGREHAESPVRVGVMVDRDRFVALLLERLAAYRD